MELRMTQELSPNYNDRPDGLDGGPIKPWVIVIHGTAGTDAGDLAWLTNPESRVSYHYLIQRDGLVIQLVTPEKRAWHAGRSQWNGHEDVNDFSIGIGLSHRGHNFTGRDGGYTNSQYQALNALIEHLCQRGDTAISDPDDIIGHRQCNSNRLDPWDFFEWDRVDRSPAQPPESNGDPRTDAGARKDRVIEAKAEIDRVINKLVDDITMPF